MPVIVLAGLGIVCVLIWLFTFPPGIIMGDDLFLLVSLQHQSFPDAIGHAFTTATNDKYRPVVSIIYAVENALFGNHFGGYEAVNMLLEMANAALVYLILRRFSRDDAVLAVIGALAFVISRFSFYNILQILGTMESLGISCTLIAIYATIVSYQLRRPRILWVAGIAYAVVLFTDERYVVLIAFIIASAVLHPAGRSAMRSGLGLSVAALACVAINVTIKSALLHAHVLVGTGGQDITFDVRAFSGFLASAFYNTIGFNVGPDYMSGRDVSEAGLTGYGIGVAMTGAILFVLIFYGREIVKKRDWEQLRFVVVALSAYVPLLISTAVTFRQDFRWLYAADVVGLLAIAAAAIAAKTSRAYVACICVFALSIFSGLYYRLFIDAIYFSYSMNAARDVRALTQSVSGRPLLIEHHGDTSYPNWVFAETAFFDLYDLHPKAVTYVAAAQPSDLAGTSVVLDIQAGHATRVSTPEKSAAAIVEPAFSAPRASRVRFDFVKQFADGAINSTARVQTPTGHGALVLDWPSVSGPVSSLTLLDGFTYQYRLRVPPNTALSFVTGRPYSNGTPTIARIDVSDGSRTIAVFHDAIKPASGGQISWQRQEVDLRRFAGHTVTVTFAATATNGDPTAAWVAFGFPVAIAR